MSYCTLEEMCLALVNCNNLAPRLSLNLLYTFLPLTVDRSRWVLKVIQWQVPKVLQWVPKVFQCQALVEHSH